MKRGQVTVRTPGWPRQCADDTDRLVVTRLTELRRSDHPFQPVLSGDLGASVWFGAPTRAFFDAEDEADPTLANASEPSPKTLLKLMKEGYDATFVVDAVGGLSQLAHRTAIERLTAADAAPNTAGVSFRGLPMDVALTGSDLRYAPCCMCRVVSPFLGRGGSPPHPMFGGL
jgi:hypothetical protein